MSDSLGMKAVNRVAEPDRLPFIKALAYIAVADDSVTLDEKKMVKQYAEAWGLSEEDQSEVLSILRSGAGLSLNELVSSFSESGTRFLLMQELMRLSYADGTYGDAERRKIAAIAQGMGMTEDRFREVEKWVGRGRAWEVPNPDGGSHSEDEFQDVLDQDTEEDYDLSDIDTEGSDLGDISPGDYDIDLEEKEEIEEEES